MQSLVLNKQRMREYAGWSRYVAGPLPSPPRLLPWEEKGTMKTASVSFPSFRDAYRTHARTRHSECNPIPP